MSAQPEPVVRRHADHDPSLTCRPALGYGLCEVLPDGVDVRPWREVLGDESDALAEWHAWWLPQWVAVSEGFCPTHRVPLEPVTCAPGWAGGRCAQCRAFWGDDLTEKSVRWTLDHEPWNHDRPVRPEWVLA